MTFLEWMLDSCRRIRKRSTVHAYDVSRPPIIPHALGRLLTPRQYINGYLTVRCKLDTSVNEKPVMDVDDVYLVQHHSVFPDERQRIQLSFLILLQAYTATRPRVLAYKQLSKDAIDDHYFGCEDEATQVE